MASSIRGQFARQLAEQESAAAALHVASEIRRGLAYVRVALADAEAEVRPARR